MIEPLHRSLDGLGAWAPLVFLVGGSVAVMFGFPRTVVAALAGILFGAAWGLILALAATTMGNAGTFFGVRYFWPVRERAPSCSPPTVPTRARPRSTAEGILLTLSIRLVPIGNGLLVSGLLARTKISAFAFAVGSLIGVAPSTAILAGLGGSLDTSLATGSVGAVVALVALLLLLYIVPRWSEAVGGRINPEALRTAWSGRRNDPARGGPGGKATRP